MKEKQSIEVSGQCNNSVPAKEVKITSIIFVLLLLMVSLVVGMYNIVFFLNYSF